MMDEDESTATTTGESPPASIEARFDAARRQGASLPVSLAIGAAMVGCLALAYGTSEQPLPAFWFAAGYLALIAQQDSRHRRIPNWLTGPALVFGIGFNIYQAGSTGLTESLLGAGLPFLVLLILYVARAIGAGDIKAFMALGALWGTEAITLVLLNSLLIGGVMALVIIIVHGEFLSLVRRWGSMLKFAVTGGLLRYQPPGASEAAAGGLPFGIAIGLGSAAFQLWGAPWL